MLMRNDLCCLAIGLASALAFVDTPLQSSYTTLAWSRILALRLLTAALVFAGWAAPLTILGAASAASPTNIDWPAYLGNKGRAFTHRSSRSTGAMSLN